MAISATIEQIERMKSWSRFVGARQSPSILIYLKLSIPCVAGANITQKKIALMSWRAAQKNSHSHEHFLCVSDIIKANVAGAATVVAVYRSSETCGRRREQFITSRIVTSAIKSQYRYRAKRFSNLFQFY